MKRRPRLAAALGLFGLVTSPLALAAPFSVGLWGDMPYSKANDAPFIPALIADMNASDIAFSVHDGDIKDGSPNNFDKMIREGLMPGPKRVGARVLWDRHQFAMPLKPCRATARLGRMSQTVTSGTAYETPEEGPEILQVLSRPARHPALVSP